MTVFICIPVQSFMRQWYSQISFLFLGYKFLQFQKKNMNMIISLSHVATIILVYEGHYWQLQVFMFTFSFLLSYCTPGNIVDYSNSAVSSSST
jgi:hypothetical protein